MVSDRMIATFFGVGALKPGPGTWGSLAAFAIGAPLLVYLGPWPLLALALAATVIGTPAAERHARALGREDPSEIVIDEAAGQWLALAACAPTWPSLVLAFLAFRIFDIVKWGPVAWAERLPGGRGIMADDLVAGALAAAVVLAHRSFF